MASTPIFTTHSKVNNVKKLNDDELRAGIAGTKASWHEQYRDSAYVYVGTLMYRAFLHARVIVSCGFLYALVSSMWYTTLDFFFFNVWR